MPERYPIDPAVTSPAERRGLFRRAPIRRRLATAALAILAPFVVAACTEELEGGATCPLTCPQEPAPFLDTVINAIIVDTTLGPYPVLGLSPNALLASRGDTIETYVVVRFDVLPSTFFPNNGTDSASIVALDSSALRLFIDSTATRSNGPFTIEVFDVDTSDNDSSSVVIRSLFRDDRKLTEYLVTPDVTGDSIRIPLPDSAVLDKITRGARIRVGLRIASPANAQVRLTAFSLGEGASRLTFDPSTDTVYQPFNIIANTSIPGRTEDTELRLSYTTYAITLRGTPDVPANVLGVGGWPSRRAYLRFDIPSSIADSSTVARAELVLTQLPAGGVDRSDSVTVLPRIGAAVSSVTDLYRASNLVADGFFGGVDSLRLVPQDSGQFVFSIVNLVRSWADLDPNVPRVIVLQLGGEGSRASEVRFFSNEAGPSLRPQLRLTYLPRREFAIP